MLKSSEDIALAFFESLIIEPKGINNYREVFFGGVEESFTSTYRCDEDSDVIHVNDFDDLGNSIKNQFSFKDFLENHLEREKKLSKTFIKLRASKILTQLKVDKTFFYYIENTLIELNQESNTIDYLSINTTVVEIMIFYHFRYNKYHTFCKEYLETLSVYQKITRSNKAIRSFKWREKNKKIEIEYLYNSLINANPPLINSSFETFYKAFTNQKLEENETIKWLCKSAKNKKVISKVSLVALLKKLFDEKYIVSDLNDFNKTVENLFCTPNGVHLKDIKGTKQEKFNNPSRIQEIQAILDGLSKIA